MKFIKEFLKNPRNVGAIAPSSKYLSNKIVENINFRDCKCIVEYGAGTGIFTEKVINRKSEDTLLLVFESNIIFYKELYYRYINKKNVKIINDGAENIKIYLEKYNILEVDYIISGLPFTSLPLNISQNILENTKRVLKENGLFITFQYSMIKRNFFMHYFPNIDVDKVMLNVPPAYILKCSQGV
ncbi:rRNA adenine N-6-methyltransferase family protein [Clostridium sp. UBA1056]|uniref:class I SAM-dependent methyltransferase n=1 Tax=unclassified Clostridium TaxID=2614128 RepID=UPI003217E270